MSMLSKFKINLNLTTWQVGQHRSWSRLSNSKSYLLFWFMLLLVHVWTPFCLTCKGENIQRSEMTLGIPSQRWPFSHKLCIKIKYNKKKSTVFCQLQIPFSNKNTRSDRDSFDIDTITTNHIPQNKYVCLHLFKKNPSYIHSYFWSLWPWHTGFESTQITLYLCPA